MPLPVPNSNESERDFLARSISLIAKDDSHKDKPHDQIVAMAYSQWDARSKQFSVQSFESALIFALDGLKPRVKIQPPKGMPWDINGQPCGYFRSEVLPVGELVDAAGRKHNVTASRADAILNDFNRALGLGHKPHIPPRHEDAGDGAKNLGYVVAAERDGDALYQIEQFIGQDAILAASRNQTSIGTLTNVTLQDGTVIAELWDHSACVPNGQLGVKSQCPLAASRAIATPLCLSRRTGDDDMPISDEQFGKIKLCFGASIPSDLSKENAVDKMLVLNQSLAAQVPQPKTAPDSTRLYLAREVMENKRDKCIRAGITTVAGAKALEASFCGKDFASENLTLARAPVAGDAEMFDGMMTCTAIYESLALAGPGIKMGANVEIAVDPIVHKVDESIDGGEKDSLVLAMKAMNRK